jgi:hypothetical protein
MRPFQTHRIQDLLAEQQPPCVSIYQPTHRQYPQSRENPIRYKNLVREIERSLPPAGEQESNGRGARSILKRLEALIDDKDFWMHRQDGLGVLATVDAFYTFDLPRSVPELAIVADSFHIKPLIRILQSADRYHVLGIGLHKAQLFEGNRDALFPVELTDVPAEMTEALGAELSEPHRSVRPNTRAGGGGGTGTTVHYGQGSKKDEVDIDRDRFFKIVDQGILDHYSQPTQLPLVLCALAEHQGAFRQLSQNRYLVSEGITANPESLTIEEMRTKAWKCIEPRYLQRLAELVDKYQVAASRALGSDELQQVAAAAIAGRVGTLLVEAERQIGGRVNRENGAIQYDDIRNAGTDDVLDDIAELVLRTGGDVVSVPKERMPTTSGLAASYRF